MSKDKIYTLEELQKKLTEKERIFCHEYIIDWNGARSARKAGYSADSAKEIAHATLTKVHIKQYIDFIKDDIAKEAGISKLSLINELKKIAYSSITNLNEDWITRKDFDKLKKENPNVLDSIQEIDTKVIRKVFNDLNETSGEFEKTPYDIEYVKIKLYDKTKAIQDILKAMGWNEPDKVDVTSQGEQLKQVFKIGDQEIEF
jgi:phage terminase small subunit